MIICSIISIINIIIIIFYLYCDNIVIVVFMATAIKMQL